MNKIVKCPDYVGVTCIDGSCPKALYEVNPQYYDLMPTCENCGFYKGCSDCAFASADRKCNIDNMLFSS